MPDGRSVLKAMGKFNKCLILFVPNKWKLFIFSFSIRYRKESTLLISGYTHVSEAVFVFAKIPLLA